MRLHPSVSHPKAIRGFETFKAYCESRDDGYDYSMVEYVNSRTKVKIICGEHGVFEQRPNHHLKGSGCPNCAGTIRTKESFAEDMKDRPITILGEYVNTYTHIECKCVMCSYEWSPTPSSLLTGYGCPKCSNEANRLRRVFNTRKFITKARSIHGDRYDYGLVEYVNCKTKVKIICPEHGMFEQVPSSHWGGNGCPKCQPGTDNNLLYIWKVVGKTYHGNPIYKIGITSKRLGETRIANVAREHNFDYKLLYTLPINNARKVESELHRKFKDIPPLTGEGKTEFRAVNKWAMAKEITILRRQYQWRNTA